MHNFAVDVIFDDAARNLVFSQLSLDELEKDVLQPELVNLASKMKASARDELGYPIKYHGDLERGLSSERHGHNEVHITQSARHNVMVRYGTQGPYSGFPMPVKTWGMQKMGWPASKAGAVAAMIQKRGTSKFFEGYHPAGSRGFDYPEYIVDKKETEAIIESAKQAGIQAVRYALGKATGSIS